MVTGLAAALAETSWPGKGVEGKLLQGSSVASLPVGTSLDPDLGGGVRWPGLSPCLSHEREAGFSLDPGVGRLADTRHFRGGTPPRGRCRPRLSASDLGLENERSICQTCFAEGLRWHSQIIWTAWLPDQGVSEFISPEIRPRPETSGGARERAGLIPVGVGSAFCGPWVLGNLVVLRLPVWSEDQHTKYFIQYQGFHGSPHPLRDHEPLGISWGEESKPRQCAQSAEVGLEGVEYNNKDCEFES